MRSSCGVRAREQAPVDEQPTLESIRAHLEEALRAIDALQQLDVQPPPLPGSGEHDE